MADQTVEPIVDADRRATDTGGWIFNIDDIKRLNFLKSCKFGFFMPTFPGCFRLQTDYNTTPINISPSFLSKLRFLCDSVEFPGQSLETTDYKISGKLRAKVPYLRRYSEINLSFYHETEFPMYDFFSRWIELASPRDTYNSYYDDIVVPLYIIQFDSVAQDRINKTGHMQKYFIVNCVNAFPVSFQSMPGNWADEGYHKLNVSFTFEDYRIVSDGADARSVLRGFNLEVPEPQIPATVNDRDLLLASPAPTINFPE